MQHQKLINKMVARFHNMALKPQKGTSMYHLILTCIRHLIYFTFLFLFILKVLIEASIKQRMQQESYCSEALPSLCPANAEATATVPFLV